MVKGWIFVDEATIIRWMIHLPGKTLILLFFVRRGASKNRPFEFKKKKKKKNHLG